MSITRRRLQQIIREEAERSFTVPRPSWKDDEEDYEDEEMGLKDEPEDDEDELEDEDEEDLEDEEFEDDELSGSGNPELDRAWATWADATRTLIDLIDEDGTLLRSDVLLMMHDHLKRC